MTRRRCQGHGADLTDGRLVWYNSLGCSMETFNVNEGAPVGAPFGSVIDPPFTGSRLVLALADEVVRVRGALGCAIPVQAAPVLCDPLLHVANSVEPGFDALDAVGACSSIDGGIEAAQEVDLLEAKDAFSDNPLGGVA